MPVLIRDDGVEFVVRAYRELLAAKKSSLVKREIQLLQHNNGDYLRLFLQPDGDYEAVFSHEEGYLLGETVWHYFDRPDDLIYCEALDDDTAILVVVRAGNVFLDAQVPVANLIDEFASLVANVNLYNIYVYGSIPLSETEEEGGFVFDQDMVASFTRLEEPLFPTLPTMEALRLLPVAEALRALPSRRASPVFMLIIGMLIIGVIWGVYEVFKPSAPVQQTTVAPLIKPKDPYAAYRSLMEQPAPEQVLIDMVGKLKLLSTVPGWYPSNLSWGAASGGNNNSTGTGPVRVQMTSFGGTLAVMRDWADVNQLKFDITGEGVALYLPAKLKERSAPTAIEKTQDAVITFMSRIQHVLHGKTVQLGNKETQGSITLWPLTINLSSVSPSVIVLVAQSLRGLPAIITGYSVTSTGGLYSGQISITLVGT